MHELSSVWTSVRVHDRINAYFFYLTLAEQGANYAKAVLPSGSGFLIKQVLGNSILTPGIKKLLVKAEKKDQGCRQMLLIILLFVDVLS